MDRFRICNSPVQCGSLHSRSTLNVVTNVRKVVAPYIPFRCIKCEFLVYNGLFALFKVVYQAKLHHYSVILLITMIQSNVNLFFIILNIISLHGTPSLLTF
jgi:hypothetical protein